MQPSYKHAAPNKLSTGSWPVWGMLCLIMNWHTGVLAQPSQAQVTDNDTTSAAPQPPDASDLHALDWAIGVFLYQEPGLMRLTGPEAKLHWQYRTQTPNWPAKLQAELGLASLQYNSTNTGSLHNLPGITARAAALWPLHVSEYSGWHLGLQIDMVWTDLRGISSTGHKGYRRLGTKAWGTLQHETSQGSIAELGVLLRGRQDSLLSDTGGYDISNTQRKGLYLSYQHSPLQGLWHQPKPWVRYSQIERSDNDRIYYEPRNKTLELGVRFNLR